MNLLSLYEQKKFDTDKYDLGYIDNFYNTFLENFKEPINFLEIGMFRCGSIKMWKEFFNLSSNIYASDINYYFNCPENVNYIIGDAYSENILNKFKNNYFDLIIDDGPHSFNSFTYLIQNYYSKIKNDCYLIIEDIIHKEWVAPLVELTKSSGYSKCEIIDMTGKQKTLELLDRWKNGLFILKIKK